MDGRERKVALDAIEALLAQAGHAGYCRGDTRDTCTCAYFTAAQRALEAVLVLQGVPDVWPAGIVQIPDGRGRVGVVELDNGGSIVRVDFARS